MRGGHRSALALAALILLGAAPARPWPQRAKEAKENNAGAAKAMLDAMQVLMMNEEEFDPDFWSELTTCWDKLDPDYMASQDGAWAGMVAYHDMDGVPGDRWGSCLDEGHCMSYLETNATQQDYHDMMIYEPCGYASNIAYYHVTTEVCEVMEKDGWAMRPETVKAVAEIMSSLGFGSSFWHGSHTYAGNVCDNRFIGVLAYMLYQESVYHLNPSTPVLRDLGLDFRPYTGVEISSRISAMFREQPVTEWADFILGIDMPDYYMSFAGIVVTVLTYSVDEATTDQIVAVLAELFSFPADDYDFLYEHLLPELRAAAADLDISDEDKAQLLDNFKGAMIKLMYSFVFHEWIITDADIIFTPEFNEAGTALLPVLNGFANTLNNFPEYNIALQTGHNVYPGDVWCNPVYPHPKWHLESAPGLQDLIYNTEFMFRLTMPS